MPSPLSWKALPSVNVATLTDAGYITAIKTIFDSAKYADGSNRTGTTSAWSTELLADGSLKLSAPNNPHGLIAHFVAATLSSNIPKSFGETVYNTAHRILGTIVLNPGTYASNTATPWGASARCFGYCHMSPLFTSNSNHVSGNITTTDVNASSGISAFSQITLRAWESKDAIVIHVWPSTLYGNIHVLGGWIAPDSSVAGAADAETDGVLYGIMTSGNNGFTQYYRGAMYSYSRDFGNTSSNGSTFMLNTGTDIATSWQKAVHPHCGVFLPGSPNYIEINRIGAFKPSFSTTLISQSNKLARMPLYFCSSTNFVGKAREMFMFNPSINGLILRSGGSGGSDRGHIVSFSNYTAYDSFVLSN